MRNFALLALCFHFTAALAHPAQHPLLAPSSASLPSLSSFGLSLAETQAFESYVASFPERRLVQLEENGPLVSITEGEKALLKFEGRRFVDVTDFEREEVGMGRVMEGEYAGGRLAMSKKGFAADYNM